MRYVHLNNLVLLKTFLPVDWGPGTARRLYTPMIVRVRWWRDATTGQVVTLAVYIYLIASLIGRRGLQSGSIRDFDIFPILTFMEYFFYMGWLKVYTWQQSIMHAHQRSGKARYCYSSVCPWASMSVCLSIITEKPLIRNWRNLVWNRPYVLLRPLLVFTFWWHLPWFWPWWPFY